MGAPLTEDWYYCPTCGSRVTVGSGGCQACAAREQVEINSELPIRDNDVSFANAHVENSERVEEFAKREFRERSRASLIPVLIAIVLSVFLVGIFLLLAMPSQ